MFRLFFASTVLAIVGSAAPRVDIGDLNSANYRIDIPDKWNGGLVMYCHGYAADPVKFDEHKPPTATMNVFLNAGYAIAQSGYAAGGWAIQEAIEDTEGLRRLFIKKYGEPKEIYITGHSLGGFLTMALIEKFPNVYLGGLPLCGPLGSPSDFLLHGAFDSRVVFDYYFPGVLPPPVDIPADYKMSKERDREVERILDSKPHEAELIRQYTKLRINGDVARTVNFVTYVLKEIEQRAGGNPFDNRNTIYTGTGDDNAVNDHVKRYQADARAIDYLRAWYTPTGRISRPMLAIHTTYDPLVPPSIPNTYADRAREAGNPDLFVQQYVKRDGHCTMSPDEIGSGFAQLRAWVKDGSRPHSGLTQAP